MPASAPTKHRRLGFRLAAIGVGLLLTALLLVAAEVTLWMLDIGRPTLLDDPHVGFASVQPLFETDPENPSQYRIAPSRHRFFAPDHFATVKASNTFRIFCLGGSTVQGRPFSLPTSFPTFLRIGLAATDPGVNWEVVNCGGISYASYRLIPILREVLTYQPDLIVLCTGHNEFLEDRSYAALKHAPIVVQHGRNLLTGLRTFQVLRQVMASVSGRSVAPPTPLSERPLLPTETRPMLDFHNSLQLYHRDLAWQADVVAHYQSNISLMIELCESAGVPVVVVLPPSNLADCPPFKSQASDGLTSEQQSEFRNLTQQAAALIQSDTPAAAELLEQAAAIDPLYAQTWSDLGKCYEALEDYPRAEAAFLKARELDICPLRMLAALETALRTVVASRRVPFLDAAQLLASQCDGGIAGSPLLVDHVHPSPEGHQQIAWALQQLLATLGWTNPTGQKAQAFAAYEAHIDTLDEAYFLKGRRTLRQVQLWTQGQADGPDAAEHFSHRVTTTAPTDK